MFKPSKTVEEAIKTQNVYHHLSTLLCSGSCGSSLSTKTPGPPCYNERTLLARRSITRKSSGKPDVLVVTTTMGMLHRVHSNTADLWPAVPPDTVLVIGIASFVEWLLCPTPTSNIANHGTPTWHNHLGSRRKFDPVMMQCQHME